jgi:glucose/mannose-6-phosphate isomerase
MAVSTGGKLAMLGQSYGSPVWTFQHKGQPRTAVGFSFGLLLAAFSRMGLLPDPAAELNSTLHAMRVQQTHLVPESPVTNNPAKRMAGQLMGRWVAVFAADILCPVARRWKGQVSEIAKAWGQFEFLPEADHNTLAGLNNPDSAISQTIALFLTAPSNHQRNLLRMEYTREIFMTQGFNTDFIRAQGDSPMAHIWTLLHFGDYTSYYLAMAYGEDPTPVEALVALKTALGKAA